MNIYELADIYYTDIIIIRHVDNKLYHVSFEGMEVKDNKDSAILGSLYGVHKTISGAMRDYCEKIQGKYAVVNAYGNRREFGIPENLGYVEN